MTKALLFAGTTEGRKIAEGCRGKDIDLTVSVATEYGETLIDPADNVHVISGRKDGNGIAALIRETGAELVMDATHPYAAEVTKTLQAVCARENVAYLRILRREDHEDMTGCEFVDDTQGAVAYLNGTEGNVLLTVGSKELPAYTAVRDWQSRLYARVLPLPASVQLAFELGMEGSHLICMQGPFSQEINEAMLRMLDARYLITKDTGAAGGFSEKLKAARACGVTPVVIRRPLVETGVSVAQCLSLLSVVNTLTALEGIDRVEFTVEGNVLIRYGSLAITEPLVQDERCVGPVRTSLGEQEAVLYLVHGSEGTLVPIPARLRPTASTSMPELVVRALLSDPGTNGIRSCIPAGTSLLGLRLENGICTVDLSGEYLDQPSQISFSCRVLAASLCALDGINGVKIRVNGSVPEGFDAEYFGILVPEADWFL